MRMFLATTGRIKILCVNSVISKYGGAEFAAMNLALGLAARGHEIHLLGAKRQISQVDSDGEETARLAENDQIHLHYRMFPRIYPFGEKHGNLRKLLWHAQDLIHPTNETLFAEVLSRVQPDAIILHNLAGVGLNIWRTVRKSGTPCIQVIHDLGLICLNVSRFRGGRQCVGLCAPCQIQKMFRFSLLVGAANFCFVSPSQAILHEIERYVDLSLWRRDIIPNPNVFLVKQRAVSTTEKPRLLYVGRLEPSKGVDVMLRAAERARHVVEFGLDILGTGSLELPLRQSYATKSWVQFHGNVDQETVADFMSRAMVLLVPSLWLENAPSVVVHALFAGLPILGSRIGGIPEHIVDGETGRLLPPGDVGAWTDEIVRVVSDRDQVAAWSAACSREAQRFDAQSALDAYERLIQTIVMKPDASIAAG